MILSTMIATEMSEQISNGYIMGPPLIRNVHMDCASRKIFSAFLKKSPAF
jgi:hypothetical protein